MFQCPYCKQEIREPEDCNEQDHNYEHECPKCGKAFVFTVDWSKSYYEAKADCLNGSPHDYQEIHGAPAWWFKDKRRCSMCGDQIELAPAVPPQV